MFHIPLPELKEKILASKRITPVELEHKIRKKINELSGLISEEGAAHIIANELGLSVFDRTQEQFKIKELYAGMRSVTTVGKVVRKFELREFVREEKAGQVASFLLGDETSTIRVVLWNDQVKLFEQLQEEDTLLVKGGYVKENRLGKEIHLGERGELVLNPPNITVSAVRSSLQFQRKSIADLQAGEESVEILGTVVQVFDPRFFLVCPECGKRVEGEGVANCVEHGMVQASVSYVLNLIVDDGTGTIRSVFWKNQILHLLEKPEQEVAYYKDNVAAFMDVKNDLLGEQFRLMGRIKRNEMFDRLEFNVQLVEKAKPDEELARLQKA